MAQRVVSQRLDEDSVKSTTYGQRRSLESQGQKHEHVTARTRRDTVEQRTRHASPPPQQAGQAEEYMWQYGRRWLGGTGGQDKEISGLETAISIPATGQIGYGGRMDKRNYEREQQDTLAATAANPRAKIPPGATGANGALERAPHQIKSWLGHDMGKTVRLRTLDICLPLSA